MIANLLLGLALWILLACMLASPVGRHIASADVIAK
jgi:hypothetical protein